MNEMNELLAICMIVLGVCAMFGAWLVSMATCPDKMINLINGPSGTTNNSSSTSSSSNKDERSRRAIKRRNKEISITSDISNATTATASNDATALTAAEAGTGTAPAGATNGGFFHHLLSASTQRMRLATANSSKKLSVVPEQDEQQTVTSLSQCIRSGGGSGGGGGGGGGGANGRLVTQQQQQGPTERPKVIALVRNGGKGAVAIPMEERCVEDVIVSRRFKQQRHWQQEKLDENPLEDASENEEEGDAMLDSASDITPIPSRCPSPNKAAKKKDTAPAAPMAAAPSSSKSEPALRRGDHIV